MRFFLKQSMLSLLSRLGILDYIHNKNRHKITVLTLHGVMEKHKQSLWEPLRPQLRPSELESILKVMSKYYHFITAEQCIGMLEGKVPIIEHALLLTFDDGYRNTIDYALPICEKFGIKPLLFIATGHIDSGKPFWFDRLDYALQQNMGSIISIEYEGVNYTFDATTRETLKVCYQQFRDDCKKSFNDDIKMNHLFNGLSHKLEVSSGKALCDICHDDDWSSTATWFLLREVVKKDRINIASHTVDHWRLNSLTQEQIFFQLQQSKVRIENELGIKCDYFCYPNGNYNTLAKNLVKKSGYIAAFSTDAGLCNEHDDLMTLKRLHFPLNKTAKEILYRLNR